MKTLSISVLALAVLATAAPIRNIVSLFSTSEAQALSPHQPLQAPAFRLSKRPNTQIQLEESKKLSHLGDTSPIDVQEDVDSWSSIIETMASTAETIGRIQNSLKDRYKTWRYGPAPAAPPDPERPPNFVPGPFETLQSAVPPVNIFREPSFKKLGGAIGSRSKKVTTALASRSESFKKGLEKTSRSLKRNASAKLNSLKSTTTSDFSILKSGAIPKSFKSYSLPLSFRRSQSASSGVSEPTSLQSRFPFEIKSDVFDGRKSAEHDKFDQSITQSSRSSIRDAPPRSNSLDASVSPNSKRPPNFVPGPFETLQSAVPPVNIFREPSFKKLGGAIGSRSKKVTTALASRSESFKKGLEKTSRSLKRNASAKLYSLKSTTTLDFSRLKSKAIPKSLKSYSFPSSFRQSRSASPGVSESTSSQSRFPFAIKFDISDGRKPAKHDEYDDYMDSSGGRSRPSIRDPLPRSTSLHADKVRKTEESANAPAFASSGSFSGQKSSLSGSSSPVDEFLSLEEREAIIKRQRTAKKIKKENSKAAEDLGKEGVNEGTHGGQ